MRCVQSADSKADELEVLIDQYLEYKFDPEFGRDCLLVCTEPAKVDTLVRGFRIDLNRTTNNTELPIWYWVIFVRHLAVARHLLLHYELDLQRDGPDNLIQFIEDRCIEPNSWKILNFTHWLVANTNVALNNIHTHPAFRRQDMVRAVRRGLDVRRGKAAIQVLLLADRPQSTCALAKSFFQNHLFDRNLVRIIASFLYDNGDYDPIKEPSHADEAYSTYRPPSEWDGVRFDDGGTTDESWGASGSTFE